MSRWLLVIVGLAAVIGFGQVQLQAEQLRGVSERALGTRVFNQESAGAAPTSASGARELLDTYCVACHNERTRTAGLTLDTMDISQVAEGASVWEFVLRKLRADAMPLVALAVMFAVWKEL